MKNILYRYGVLIICLFFSSIIFNLFLYPIKLVTGGMNGIAIIINHLLKISPSIIIFIGSSICLFLSTILLSKEQTIASLLATFIYPFFVSLTLFINKIIIIKTNDLLLTCLIIGISLGISNGFMYKVGFSNGGINIISQILYKYFKIPLSNTTLFINMIIVILGGVYFTYTKVLYAIFLLLTSKIVMDKILRKDKSLIIITS